MVALQWEDVTVHLDTNRSLKEEPQVLPEDALVRRVPSPTVFTYKLANKPAS